MNLHGTKRDAMANLSPERKAYLIAQSRQTPSRPATVRQSTPVETSPSPSDHSSPKPASFISLSAGTSLGLTRLLPQLTGSNGSTPDTTRSPNPSRQNWTKRLSIASLGSWTGVGTESDLLGIPKDDLQDGEITPKAEISSLRESTYGGRSIERQYTGGLWGWWSGASKPEEGSPAHFIEALRSS